MVEDRREKKRGALDVPIGVKATVMRNGKLLYARTFTTGDEALEWADEEHRKLLAQDWRETGEET